MLKKEVGMKRKMTINDDISRHLDTLKIPKQSSQTKLNKARIALHKLMTFFPYALLQPTS